jgi:hypothetical protein
VANLRLFLAIATAMDLDLCQLDIDNAFLYASIKEVVYVRQPLGFVDGVVTAYHRKRCLYGLNQFSSELSTPLRDYLVDNGWQQCMWDPCIYILFLGQRTLSQ